MPTSLRVTPVSDTLKPDTDADAPMTEVQAAKLRELCEKHDEPFDGNLTEVQASERIEYLESRD